MSAEGSAAAVPGDEKFLAPLSGVSEQHDELLSQLSAKSSPQRLPRLRKRKKKKKMKKVVSQKTLEKRWLKRRVQGWDDHQSNVHVTNPAVPVAQRVLFSDVGKVNIHKIPKDPKKRTQLKKHTEYFVNTRDPFYYDPDRELDWNARFVVPPSQQVFHVHHTVYAEENQVKFPFMKKADGPRSLSKTKALRERENFKKYHETQKLRKEKQKQKLLLSKSMGRGRGGTLALLKPRKRPQWND